VRRRRMKRRKKERKERKEGMKRAKKRNQKEPGLSDFLDQVILGGHNSVGQLIL
jgi:hypothetical protein